MYIGHVGAALAGKRARVSVSLLVLLIATYIPDWIDSGLCILGGYDPRQMLSHSIPAVVILAFAGCLAYARITRDLAGGSVIAALIVSHMLFDWITGTKPTWPGGPTIGLDLYAHPIADFLAESIVIAIGAVAYAGTLSRRRRPWMDMSIMLGALLALQLSIDVAHLLMKSLPKC